MSEKDRILKIEQELSSYSRCSLFIARSGPVDLLAKLVDKRGRDF
jgi:hypothetical protein